MAMRTLNAPLGPRAGRNGESTRQSHRGGIQKRGPPKTRLDKDGDLVMDLGTGIKGRGRGTNNRRETPGATSHGSPVHGHPAPSKATRPTRVDPTPGQKALLLAIASKEPKRLRGVSRLVKLAGKDIKEDGTSGSLDQIKVYGLKESKAASNPGGGVKDLLDFLERKATAPNAPSREAVRIRKSRHEGDTTVISVRPEDTPKITRLNGFTFAGANLRIELYKGSTTQTSSTTSPEAADVKELLTNVLARRYVQESRLLDLSNLGGDFDLVNIGMFGSDARTSKFFPALMKVCDGFFTTEQQKTEAVVSVSLANNELINLEAVTTLAQTFPSLKNLDLSNNQFKSVQALDRWRMKFRKLEHLLIAGNPLENGDPTFMAELMKWFPNLRTIGTTQVRNEEDIKAAKSSQMPIPTAPASFRDELDISKDFITRFFPGYDQDRCSVLRDCYDDSTTFSLNVNTSAPRDQSTAQSAVSWDRYIKSSRNLRKINHLHARVNRMYTGQRSIEAAWKNLPLTRHPDLMTEPEKWCIECHSLPGVPDGQTPGGVGGLIITVHGEFTEVDDRTGNPDPNIKRSFDRVFVLGPGSGTGGIRVVNDMLTLRAYGGFQAFKPDTCGTPSPEPQTALPQNPLCQQLGLPDGFGMPMEGKSEEQVLKEQMAMELTSRTRMTIQYSGMCLEESGWNLEGACRAFEGVKGNLPQEAFVQL